jgi:hypothetical protein
MIRRSMPFVLVVLVAFVACDDPVQSAEIAALGPEDPNVPVGELHRPGQPCTVCHDNFSIGGTIYHDDLTTPYDSASVTLVDAANNQYTATTNSAGNFFVRKSDWQPVFPIGAYTVAEGGQVYGVTVVGDDPTTPSQMFTHMGRTGSCATCHFGSGPAANTPGPVFVQVKQP